MKSRIPILLLILFVGLIYWSCASGPTHFDVLIRNGLVYDGSGKPGFDADVGVLAGRIAAMGNLENATADRIIDAANKIVAPGFIDLHTHAERRIIENPGVENYIRQGVTTVLGGNCGDSPLPVGRFLDRIDSSGIALNLALLVGHNSVRRMVMGTENRDPTPEEFERMKDLTEQAMREGAFGLSTGLKYIPGAYSKMDEVVGLAGVAAEHGGFYATHMRDEGLNILESLEEALEIGRQGDLPVQISHHKIVGKTMWETSIETLRMIDEAVDSGMDVTFDQYPYTATSTGLTVLFPAWSLADGQEAIRGRMDDPSIRARIKQGIIDNIEKDRGGGDPANVVVTRFSSNTQYNGKNLAEITRLRRRRPTIPNAAETLMELVYEGGGSAIYHCLSESDVKRIMRHPRGTVGSDGGTVAFGRGVVHPRNYGAFPRVLGRYVKEGVLTLEEAVRKMTSLPARRMGLKDRGVIRKGAVADLNVIDPETVIDPATFLEPHQYPTGIPYVLVSGILVVDEGAYTGARPGKSLRKP